MIPYTDLIVEPFQYLPRDQEVVETEDQKERRLEVFPMSKEEEEDTSE